MTEPSLAQIQAACKAYQESTCQSHVGCMIAALTAAAEAAEVDQKDWHGMYLRDTAKLTDQAIEEPDATIERLRADNEKYKEWCRKLIEGGSFPGEIEATIERCAKVAEEQYGTWDIQEPLQRKIAAAIRALKEKP